MTFIEWMEKVDKLYFQYLDQIIKSMINIGVTFAVYFLINWKLQMKFPISFMVIILISMLIGNFTKKKFSEINYGEKMKKWLRPSN